MSVMWLRAGLSGGRVVLRGIRVWGAFLVGAVWMGTVLYGVQRFLASTLEDRFREEGCRLAEVWAARWADAPTPDAKSRVLKRFSGELDAATVLLLDNEGLSCERIGDLVAMPSWRSSTEPQFEKGPPGLWFFRAPAWVDGRKNGYVAWARRSSSIDHVIMKARRTLVFAWVWWVAVSGALALALLASHPNTHSH